MVLKDTNKKSDSTIVAFTFKKVGIKVTHHLTDIKKLYKKLV